MTIIKVSRGDTAMTMITKGKYQNLNRSCFEKFKKKVSHILGDFRNKINEIDKKDKLFSSQISGFVESPNRLITLQRYIFFIRFNFYSRIISLF